MNNSLPYLFQSALFLAIAVFLTQAVWVWREKPLPSILRPLSYLSYTFVVLSGIYMFMQVEGKMGYAQIAPVILFFVAVSSTLKSQRTEATLIQKKAGLVISAFAYIGLLSFLLR